MTANTSTSSRFSPAQLLATGLTLAMGFGMTLNTSAEVLGEAALEAEALGAVAFEAEHYRGELNLKDLTVVSGAVAEGQVVGTFAADDQEVHDEFVANAKRDYAERQQDLAFAARQEAIELAEVAQNELDLKRYIEDERYEVAFWNEHGSAAYLRQLQFRAEDQESYLETMRNEVAQLEELYKDERIHGVTRDVVLDRNRRELEKTEAAMPVARLEMQRAIEVDYPLRNLRMQESLAEAERNFENRIIGMEQQEIRRARQARQQAEQIENAKEEYEALLEETTVTSLTADENGYFVANFAEGDTFRPGQSVGTIYRQGGTVSLQLSLETINTLSVGDAIFASVPELELDTEVTVRSIAWQGRARGDTTLFGVEFELNNDQVRPGMNIVIGQPEELTDGEKLEAAADAVEALEKQLEDAQEQLEELTPEPEVEEVVEEAVEAAEAEVNAVEALVEAGLEEVVETAEAE